MSDAFHIQTGLKQGKGKVVPVLFLKLSTMPWRCVVEVEV